jgi:hypothetical protein
MSEQTEIKKNDSVREDGKPTMLFWAVSLLAVIWGVSGAIDFYLIKTAHPDYLANLPVKFKDLIEGFPLWREVLWYISIGGALIGGLLMLLRSAWAVPFLWAVPITMLIGFVGYDLLMANGVEAYGTFGILASTIMIIISLILALYAAGCDEDEILK